MGERYICGSFDISTHAELSSFDDSEGCGKDFASKVSLVDHIRTTHLGLRSVFSAKRKQNTKIDDNFINDKDDESYSQPKLSKRKAKKSKASKVDQLLGLSYAIDPKRNIPCHDTACPRMFIREYDRQIHMQSTHPFFQQYDPTTSTPNQSLQYTAPDSNIGADGPDPGVNAEPLQSEAVDQADIDWELQRQALEGGPFWVGAVDEVDAFQSHDEEWTHEALEMRRLIG